MTKEELVRLIKSEIAGVIGQEPDDLDEETNFFRLGISSVQALKMMNRLRKNLEIDISPCRPVRIQDDRRICRIFERLSE
ncbi:acyl carrier protein [Thermobacillus xylanilyticus]|uniref:acyl carrier protein n=1 Tax=Thermobacillus xylanilyticus TaxID=76633 RepID=UPI001BCB892F|nr:acyl carrier protein [Thermobacillus xylanilyticus]